VYKRQAQSTQAAPLAPSAAEKNLPAAQGLATLGVVAVTTDSYSEPPSEKTGSYTVQKTQSATKFDLSPRETPQTVSVVTRAQIDDFRMTSVNDILDNVAGINVERVEPDRTYYTARGFDITNFQLDGIGSPFTYGLVNGDLDTAVYDRAEVLMGANGLMSSTGNPSATVNFIRKRPTDKFQGKVGATLGSWNLHRLEGDLAGPLTKSGNIRGRLVLVGEEADSYLKRYSHDKNVIHGVVEADLTEATLLTLGYTRQANRTKSPMWGALPLYFTDGTPTNYDRSTSTSPDWTWWNTTDQAAFLELSHRFDNDWQAKAIYTYKTSDSASKLFYVYGTPDRQTGAGLAVYPSLYDSDSKQTMLDVYASGPVALAGRSHDLMLGANWSRAKIREKSHYGQGIGDPLPELATWDGQFPEPTFDARTDGSRFTDERSSLYAALRLNLADRLKLILGGNLAKAESEGSGYGESHDKSDTAFTPYVGAIFDVTKNWSLYANYAEIFNPQSQLDAIGNRLKPIEGKSFEVGLKGELLEKNLNTNLAFFKVMQDNTAEAAGFDPVTFKTFYKGVNATSQGMEFSANGNLTAHLQAGVGYTLLSIEGDGGRPARTFVPRQVLHLSATYRLPFLEKLKVGAKLKWQDEISYDQGGGITTTQEAYALLDLMARYEFSDKLDATLNVKNVTDQKYLSSLYWSQAFYGAPINGTLSLNYKF
jgi:outer membrane receptor for ferric coprogen and ferric-rhodotorulic acid